MEVMISLIDITGRIIQQMLPGSGKFSLDEFPAGFYVVRVEGDLSLEAKLVIE